MSWKTIPLIVVLVVLVSMAAGLVRDRRIEADFPAIRAKSSEADVRHLMGNPKEVHRTCEAFDTTVMPDCDHVLIYRSVFAPLRSKYWLVFFDKNDEVTATSSELEP